MTASRFSRLRARLRSQSGTSLVETMVTLSIIGSLMGISVLGINRRYFDLETTGQKLLNDIRVTRMQATLKATRYRIKFDVTSYAIERLHDPDGDGTWTVNSSTPPRTITLPAGFQMLSVSGIGWGSSAIFDGRGMLLKDNGSQGYNLLLILVVAPDGEHRLLRLWPSGQAEFLEVLPA